MAAGETGRAVWLSGQFQRAIADIAEQATIAAFIATLVSRSSLIIALYWSRRDTLCESHAHHALLDAIAAAMAEQLAEEQMQSHLVDLLSGLDLREKQESPRSLSEMLGDLMASRPMSLADLGRALDWAAAEGWNQGLTTRPRSSPPIPKGS